jgi:hypothetical protein
MMHPIARQCVALGRALRVEVVCSSSRVRLGAQDDPSSCDRENDSGGEGRLPEGGSFAWISAAACDQARETDVSERDKLTFSERDKLQREKRSEGNSRRPRNGRAQQRARWASGAYKRKVEERLFGKKEDAPRRRLEQRLREAHDTPNFLRIYREYTKSFGMPEAIDLLLLLLDLGEDREIVRVLKQLGATVDGAPQEQRSLLRSRLRNLEMSASSDAVADAAADLLGQL